MVIGCAAIRDASRRRWAGTGIHRLAVVVGVVLFKIDGEASFDGQFQRGRR